MLRRPYTVSTTLLEPLLSRHTVAFLADSSGLELSEGDWAYLQLREFGKVEIVKVTQLIGDSIRIIRGVDNTKAQDFVNPEVSYVLTAAEIFDSIPDSGQLALYGEGGASVEGTVVDVPRVLVGYVGVHYSFGSDSVIRIGRQENAYGCCGADNDIGSLGFGIFYLTSLVYPVEAVEGINSLVAVGEIYTNGSRTHSQEAFNLGFTASVSMRPILQETEQLESLDLTFTPSVIMRVILRTIAPQESLDLGFAASVEMRKIVIATDPIESVDLTYAVQSISLY